MNWCSPYSQKSCFLGLIIFKIPQPNISAKSWGVGAIAPFTPPSSQFLRPCICMPSVSFLLFFQIVFFGRKSKHYILLRLDCRISSNLVEDFLFFLLIKCKLMFFKRYYGARQICKFLNGIPCQKLF